MVWKIDFALRAVKFMKKLKKNNPALGARIINELSIIVQLTDPHSRGKAITGNYQGYWRLSYYL